MQVQQQWAQPGLGWATKDASDGQPFGMEVDEDASSKLETLTNARVRQVDRMKSSKHRCNKQNSTNYSMSTVMMPGASV